MRRIYDIRPCNLTTNATIRARGLDNAIALSISVLAPEQNQALLLWISCFALSSHLVQLRCASISR